MCVFICLCVSLVVWMLVNVLASWLVCVYDVCPFDRFFVCLIVCLFVCLYDRVFVCKFACVCVVVCVS